MPMWWSLPPWRGVTLPVPSMRSVRTRSWVSLSRVPGAAFGPGGVGGGGGGPVRQGPVRPLVVADAREGVQQGLQLVKGRGLGRLGGEPVLQGLLEPLGLALGLGLSG